MLQEILAVAIVGLAFVAMLYRFVIGPALRRRGPDVPTSALVRRRPKRRAPSPPGDV